MKFCLAGLGILVATVFVFSGCKKSTPPVVDQPVVEQPVKEDTDALRAEVKQAVDSQLKKNQ